MTLNKIKPYVNLEKKSLVEMALKLSEESGEVAQAILSLNKVSGSTYKALGFEEAIEECIDVILVAYVLYEKLNDQLENSIDFEAILETKIQKWINKMDSVSDQNQEFTDQLHESSNE